MHFTGKDRFMAIKASFLATGLTTRVHGNSRRVPKHALKLDEVKHVVTFLSNYAEKNAILLPGRIPGYKRDDLQLLPSNTTKKVVFRNVYTPSIMDMTTCIVVVSTVMACHVM